ncbi:polysaccharide deacetylase family protein [Paenibacillus ferrarius]|uniref:polysaccharide deacetylase family protein n=1 Tax=Paenibacillus ferrarius TaxID=1469647 RepID=UPI003D280E13
MRRRTKSAATSIAAVTILALLCAAAALAPARPVAAAGRAEHGVAIPVLNYHSIGVAHGNPYVLHPDAFARQMNYLAAQHYTPLTLDAFVRVLAGQMPSPNKPVLLTFDDGYANNAETAMPILREHHFPATLFLSTGLVDLPGYLSWQQVRELAEANWDVMPHTVTHPHLPKLDQAHQRAEIMDARRKIEAVLGKPAPVFAYPYGEYNRTTLRILRKNGFRYAFSTDDGWATNRQNPYKLKRIVVRSEDALETWARKLTDRDFAEGKEAWVPNLSFQMSAF